MKLFAFLFSLLLPVVLWGQKIPGKFELPSLICDNMVLQQKENVKIWGKAKAGQQVNINTNWKASGKAQVDKDGNWQVSILTPGAGGPYTLNIKTPDTSVLIQNIMIGEVWFCSGQSNMEMSLAGWPPNDTIMNSKYEIATASYDKIRLFNVQRAVSMAPENNCSGKWEVCSPNTVSSFSATAYFFGKRLYKQLGIPIGLIASAWGGTPVESWISSKSLKEAGEFVSVLDQMEDAKPMYNEFIEWLTKHDKVVANNQFKEIDFRDGNCSLKNFNDAEWPVMKLPQMWELTAISEFDGVIWFRKKVVLPEQMKGKELILSLGPIDDMDRTYVNGTYLGGEEESGFWQKYRNYTIPASLNTDGEIVIAVRVIDTQGGGGLWGKNEQMKISVKENSSVEYSIAGDWKYMPVAEMIDNKFYLYDIVSREFFTRKRPMAVSPYIPSVLYNGMVKPVTPYHIKGAIWYQGESNVGRAEQYAKIFPLMIQDWRKAWGIPEFPFYYVQIAPWEYEGSPDSTSSAALREAQTKAMKLPKTGMIVTLDIGKVYNIHPPDKTTVGNRLAQWALAKDYNVKVPFSGPVYKSMSKEGNALRLCFDYADSGLTALNGELKEFEIAGENGKYFPAKAWIDGREVVVSSPSVSNPVAVRYCWRNGAEGTLFNKEGLPASVFKTK